MKIMFFCWAQEMQTEFSHLAKYLAEYPQQFIITPLIRHAEKRKYEKTVSDLKETSKNVTVSPIYLKSSNSSFSNLLNPNTLLSDFGSIFKVLESSKPDAVVCFYISHAYPLVLLKKISNFHLCIVAMGSDINLDTSLLQKLARKMAYRNSDLIFARSWKLKDLIEEEQRCSVIVNPSSTDVSFFRPLGAKMELREKWGINPVDHVVLSVCRLDKNKAVDILLKALHTLGQDGFRLLVVGDGVEREALAEQASELGLNSQVSFLGPRNRDELLELYNLSDVFALASYAEGLPRVVIEAMACGCIPVVTKVGSVPAVVKDGFNGFLVTPGNYEELASKIKEATGFPEEQIALMQERACCTVMDEFDSRKTTRQMIDSISGLFIS
jgi:glycosyltransferase involved in cell wall biosynthesis